MISLWRGSNLENQLGHWRSYNIQTPINHPLTPPVLALPWKRRQKLRNSLKKQQAAVSPDNPLCYKWDKSGIFMVFLKNESHLDFISHANKSVHSPHSLFLINRSLSTAYVPRIKLNGDAHFCEESGSQQQDRPRECQTEWSQTESEK